MDNAYPIILLPNSVHSHDFDLSTFQVKHFRNGSATNPLTWQNKKHSHWLVLPVYGLRIRRSWD